MENETFTLGDYFQRMEKIIDKIGSRPEKEVFTYDILDTKKVRTYKQICLREKHRQMKIGEIWQALIGNYQGFMDLKQGHETGLDILSPTRKIAIELKNRTNTDNASSRKSNLDKLARFKRNHPDFVCIYANINADTEKKTLGGYKRILFHDDQEIEHQVGLVFLRYIFGKDTIQIIQFIRQKLEQTFSYGS